MLTKKQKKGQASFEFMLSYGWAIFIILITVGLFIYIIPHTKNLTNNRCTFGPATPCLGVALTPENVTIVLQNNVGQTIYNLKANITLPSNTNCIVNNSATLRAEEKVTIVCDNSVIKIQSNSKIQMMLTYNKIKNGYDQVVLGDIYAK